MWINILKFGTSCALGVYLTERLGLTLADVEFYVVAVIANLAIHIDRK